MHCELVVPNLFSAGAGGRYRALELLLARGRRTIEQPKPEHLERWLHAAFELDEGPFPAGALSLIATNGDPGNDCWLRADPVHLRLMRDRAIVEPAEALSISRAEADAFCASLNSHFTGVMQLHPLDPRRWCARIEKVFSSNDESSLESAGREVLPGDPLLNEIQMLLHAHPLNEAREARGEPPINSLWLWGAGRARRASSRWNSVLANEPLAMGLAMLAGTRYRSLPAGAQSWLEGAPGDGRHLVVLDALRVPAALDDVASYEKNLNALEAAWFAPLLRALRAGRIGMVTVHVPDAAEAVSFEAIRGDLRRFWRRPKTLASYA